MGQDRQMPMDGVKRILVGLDVSRRLPRCFGLDDLGLVDLHGANQDDRCRACGIGRPEGLNRRPLHRAGAVKKLSRALGE